MVNGEAHGWSRCFIEGRAWCEWTLCWSGVISLKSFCNMDVNEPAGEQKKRTTNQKTVVV